MKFFARCFETAALISKELKWQQVKNIEEADVVFFPGGADVNPELYGERNVASFIDPYSDNIDLKHWNLSANKIKIGICRGSQFLNVMNGGSLWQDVNNHTSKHQAMDTETGQTLRVTSTHHQMMRPTSNAKILMIAYKATHKLAEKENINNLYPVKEQPDIEAVYYPETRSLCCQFHPEYGNSTPEEVTWFINKIKELFSNELQNQI